MTVQTKATLTSNANTDLANNTTQDISPADVRNIIIDIIDTMGSVGGDLHFESAEQTITSSGTLTIAHGLSGMPSKVTLELVCKTAEYGYAINDIVIGDIGGRRLQHSGSTVWADATNIYVQFGSAATVYELNRRDAPIGQLTPITNANWRAVFIAEV